MDDTRTIQILATEHWSLLATRSLSWTESFSRTSMLLATLSATVVALALAAQVGGFGRSFIAFALVVLPFVELVGVATFVRLGEADREDLVSIQGMNRIRHAYLEIAPQLEPYLVAGRRDDLRALFETYGMGSGSMSSIGRGLHHAFVMTQGMVGVINAMVAGIFGFLSAVFLGAQTVVAIAAALSSSAARSVRRWSSVFRCFDISTSLTFRFPTASGDERPRWRQADRPPATAMGPLDNAPRFLPPALA